jgi:uncharacterized delta-60 repeat protein
MRSARTRHAFRTAGVVLALGIAAGIGRAAGGDFDPSFSGDGWVRTLEVRAASNNYLPEGAEDVAIQPDGKIVVVGEVQDGRSQWYFGAFRYLPDGSLDRSFAGSGWVALDLGSFEFAHAVALQPDGKIVVAGEADCPRAICFAVARFLTDGTLDRSFGDGGVVRTMFAQCGCRAYDVAVQRDGRIVAVGWRFRYGDAQDDDLFAVARYLPDGRLDRSFSRDGLASIDFGFGDDVAHAVAVQPDGKIVVAGHGTRNRYRTEDDFAFVRFRRDGALDRGFGGDGLVTVDFGGRRYDAAHALAVQPNGAIVAAGSSGGREAAPGIALLRLRRDGSLDRTFGSGGRRLTSPSAHGGYSHAVLRQPDGRIVVAGRVFGDEKRDASDWVLARYGTGGRLDASFGRGGIAFSDYGTGADSAEGLALDREGRIVAVGSIHTSQALARYRAR